MTLSGSAGFWGGLFPGVFRWRSKPPAIGISGFQPRGERCDATALKKKEGAVGVGRECGARAKSPDFHPGLRGGLLGLVGSLG